MPGSAPDIFERFQPVWPLLRVRLLNFASVTSRRCFHHVQSDYRLFLTQQSSVHHRCQLVEHGSSNREQRFSCLTEKTSGGGAEPWLGLAETLITPELIPFSSKLCCCRGCWVRQRISLLRLHNWDERLTDRSRWGMSRRENPLCHNLFANEFVTFPGWDDAGLLSRHRRFKVFSVSRCYLLRILFSCYFLIRFYNRSSPVRYVGSSQLWVFFIM